VTCPESKAHSGIIPKTLSSHFVPKASILPLEIRLTLLQPALIIKQRGQNDRIKQAFANSVLLSACYIKQLPSKI
jgi:hypothetical protein